jgi:hypothetical protein
MIYVTKIVEIANLIALEKYAIDPYMSTIVPSVKVYEIHVLTSRFLYTNVLMSL